METETTVTIDGWDDESYPCLADLGQRWNGFVASPRFTRETVQKITDTLAEIGDDTFAFTKNGALVQIDETGSEFELWEPDADGRYALGAFAWCWVETEEVQA